MDKGLCNSPIFTRTVITDSDDSILFAPISDTEIEFHLRKCTNRSAPGVDNIPYPVIKQIHHLLPYYIPLLFNSILYSCKYPSQWKNAFITPVFKKGDIHLANNYRPIMLQSCLAKLFSRVLEKRLRSWLGKFAPLNDNQFGFCPNRSTTDAAMVFQTTIAFNIQRTFSCAN